MHISTVGQKNVLQYILVANNTANKPAIKPLRMYLINVKQQNVLKAQQSTKSAVCISDQLTDPYFDPCLKKTW